MKSKTCWWSVLCYFCNTPYRQAYSYWWLRCQSWHRPSDSGSSNRIEGHRQMQQQWHSAPTKMCCSWSADHQYVLPSPKPQQAIMDASSFQALASQWLCHSAEECQTECQSDKDHVWSRHIMIVSKVKLRRRPQDNKAHKRLDVSQLKLGSKRKQQLRCSVALFRGAIRGLDSHSFWWKTAWFWNNLPS